MRPRARADPAQHTVKVVTVFEREPVGAEGRAVDRLVGRVLRGGHWRLVGDRVARGRGQRGAGALPRGHVRAVHGIDLEDCGAGGIERLERAAEPGARLLLDRIARVPVSVEQAQVDRPSGLAHRALGRRLGHRPRRLVHRGIVARQCHDGAEVAQRLDQPVAIDPRGREARDAIADPRLDERALADAEPLGDVAGAACRVAGLLLGPGCGERSVRERVGHGLHHLRSAWSPRA